MDFQLIPEAQASVTTLIKKIDGAIINPIIFFLFAAAMAYFIWGVVQYLLSPDNEEIRKTSKAQMIWGIIGLFIMISVFSIMRLIVSTLGAQNKVKIELDGDFKIITDTTTTDISSIDQKTYDLNDDITKSNSTEENASNPSDSGLTTIAAKPPINSYTTSPFTTQYISNPQCWRAEIYGLGITEYKALQDVKQKTRLAYLAAARLPVNSTINPSLPTTYGVLSAYDSVKKIFYVWWDVRAPINGGKGIDCNLVPVLGTTSTGQTSTSSKPSPLKTYSSDATYYRATGSGVATTYVGARTVAINNAAMQIAILKGQANLSNIAYTIIEEKYYPPDPSWPNYDYFVAVQSAK